MIAAEAVKYTPLSEFLAVKQQMESLRKAVEEENELTRNSINRSRDLEVKEEISLLEKETSN